MDRTEPRHLHAIPSSDPAPLDAVHDAQPQAPAVPDLDDLDDIVLPSVSPEAQALFDKMDALTAGMTPEEHSDALRRMYFSEEGDPVVPPKLRAIPASSAPAPLEVPFSDAD